VIICKELLLLVPKDESAIYNHHNNTNKGVEGSYSGQTACSALLPEDEGTWELESFEKWVSFPFQIPSSHTERTLLPL
jgi:hypothetical protein